MSSYGFPTYLQYSRLSSSVADIKARTDLARTELVTGRIADMKSALGVNVGDAQLLRKAIDDIESTQSSISRALGRTQTAQIALNRASDTVVELSANLLSAVGQNDENAIGIGATQARLQLEGAISAFNSRFEGRSLFAGDAVSSPALADADVLLNDVRTIFAGATDQASLNAALDAYFDDPAGGFMTNVYTGGAGDAPRTEIADGELLNYSARADEQPVRDLLRNLAVFVVAHEETAFADRSAVLAQTGEGLASAVNGITEIRSRIGAAEERMTSTQARLETEFAALSATYNERTAVDPYEAATRLQQLESQLEASYVVTSRITQLTLANFLR